MNIAFVCTQNSCRSQISEAFGKKYFNQKINVYSAGTDPASEINNSAVRLMKEYYSIDMEKEQYPKKLDKLPNIDILVTMGCGVKCPFVPCKKLIELNIEDPAGKSDEIFLNVIAEIKGEIQKLSEQFSDL